MFYDLEKLKCININKLIVYYGLGQVNDKMVLCPAHEMDGKEHSPSCAVDYSTNVMFCKSGKCDFSNKRLDVINIVSIMEKRPNRGEGFKLNCQKLLEIDKEVNDCNIRNLDEIKSSKVIKKEKEQKKENKDDTYYKYNQNSINIHQLHYKNDDSLDVYLEKRCIDFYAIQDILNKNNIVIKQQTLKNYDTGEVLDRICYIFDNNRKFAIARKTGDYLFGKVYPKIKRKDIKDNVKQDVLKFNSTNPYYSYLKTPPKEGKKLLIFEGFYDCLSFMSNCKNKEDYDYVSLNSTIYMGKFYEDNKDNLQYNQIICLLDNDPSGASATRFFVEYLPGEVVDYSYLYRDFNDVNDYIRQKGGLNIEQVQS